MSGDISTGAVQGTGIAIGQGAQATVQVLGDLHYHPVTLTAPLREAFRPLIDDRLSVFAGRDEPLREIARFLADPHGGYLALTAPAGFGKTALAASLARAADDRLAYHFFTTIYGPSGLSEEFFLRSLVEQLAAWHGRAGQIPADIFALRALYQSFLAAPLERPGAILLDGLDEVSGWPLAPYLPPRLGDGLHVVVTIRDAGQDWATQYGLRTAARLALGGLTREQVAAVVPETLIDEVMRATAVAGGGADPFYVRVLAEDARAGELTTAASPAGLDRYLDAWWRDVEADLFGLLAVARGPIGRCELAQLLEGFDADAIPRRFVAGDDRGYSLVHPRLREYLRERLDTERHEQRLLEYCRAHRSPYVLEHFASHLAERGQLEELQRLVLGGEWYEVAGVEHYLRDVRLTWRLSEGSPGVETRCALAVASVNSLAGSVPPALAAALVAAGEWTRERALAYARQIPDAGQRAETLVALLDGDERTRQEALDAAEAAVRPHSESIFMNAPDPWVPGRHGVRIFAPPREPGFRALAELRPSQTVLERALDAWDEHWTRTGDPQPGALELLAPLLGPELLEEALEIVRGHADDAPDGWSGPETAACFAVLGAADEAIDAALREAKLSGLEAVMPLAPSGELVQAGLEAALEREHQAFYRSLMALDPGAGPFEGYVSDEDRVAWISTVPGPADELLVCLDSEAHRAWVGGDFERALELGGARTELLTAIAPELPDPLVGRWLSLLGESRPDCGDVHRARAAALAALARRAPDARLEEVLWVSAGLRDPAPALQALAPRLPRPLLAEAARITGVIGDQRARAKALAALGQRRRAVGVALEDPEWWRDEALFDEIAPDLDTAQLERALVGAARDPVVARRLEHWLARVEPGEEGAALRAVHAVADPEVRAAALAALVPLLPEERLAEAAAEAEALPGPERVIASLQLVLRAPPAQQLDAAQELAAVFHAVETYDGAWLRALARFAVALPEPDASAWADVALGLIDQFPRGDDDAFRALELLASRATGVLERVGRFGDYRQSLLLTALAERAPEQVLARALEIANPWYRARVLPALDQFDLALETLVEAAPDDWGDIETFGDPGSYAFLAQLVARHPERAGDALAVVAEHLDEIQREAALLALAPVLPEPSLDESVALALETGAWQAVGALARRLDGPRRDAAIAHARSETTGWGRIALAAAAPPDVLVELVCEELEDGFRGSIAEPLGELEGALPPESVLPIWTAVLRKLPARDRAALLEDIAWFGPPLHAAVPELAAVVEEVGRTWP